MSSTEETELKAGHPPAVKAGGMRVARHRTSSGAEKEQTMTKEEQEEYGTEAPEVDTHHQEVLVSGAVGKGDKDFQADAVKQYHVKPQASKVKSHAPPPHNIHQPR